MCSGCSGDYAGGFDDSGEPDTGSDDENLAPLHRCEAIKSSGRGNSECGSGDRHSQMEAGSVELPEVRADRPEQDWEIFVSATRIVEVRFFGGIRREGVEWRGAQPGRAVAAGYHSNAESAKYYQSCRGSAEAIADAAGRRRNPASAAENFRRCVRSAWKAIGELRRRGL